MKIEEARLAALSKERGGPADNDDGEAVVVCTRRLYSQQCVHASPVMEDVNMDASSQGAGADGGANNGKKSKG